jgi:hypothetical protein
VNAARREDGPGNVAGHEYGEGGPEEMAVKSGVEDGGSEAKGSQAVNNVGTSKRGPTRSVGAHFNMPYRSEAKPR